MGGIVIEDEIEFVVGEGQVFCFVLFGMDVCYVLFCGVLCYYGEYFGGKIVGYYFFCQGGDLEVYVVGVVVQVEDLCFWVFGQGVVQ